MFEKLCPVCTAYGNGAKLSTKLHHMVCEMLNEAREPKWQAQWRQDEKFGNIQVQDVLTKNLFQGHKLSA